jgi:hypothetical protein
VREQRDKIFGTTPKSRLPVSFNGLLPADFALGSPASRAAARRMLEMRSDATARWQLVHRIPRAGMVAGRRYVTEWRKWDDGSLMRLVYLPEGETTPAADEEPDGQTLWPNPPHPGLRRISSG